MLDLIGAEAVVVPEVPVAPRSVSLMLYFLQMGGAGPISIVFASFRGVNVVVSHALWQLKKRYCHFACHAQMSFASFPGQIATM